MEKRDKIIIAGLVIAIIALLAAIFMVGGNNISSGVNISDGMQKYDFNSEFTMAVPENASFLKEWNNSNEFNIGSGYTYYDKANRFGVFYANSPIVTHELVNTVIESGEHSENVTVEKSGDLIMLHNPTADGKIGLTLDDSNYREQVVFQKGHLLIVVVGNDAGFIKSMAETIRVYE
ncbi:MAG: hypothetical protein E7Z77_06520 [Methanobrevibacter sp.]|uniref:hypothetical protein n=1 Tax=Methanobrevibacter sp. TaxID=66852 RepID=UPI0025DDEB7D|nr:hypothetical protein [Methanobrevibacter sp.]MBE6509057.1 hypothetical protein [Methanobrevibacter sp.]